MYTELTQDNLRQVIANDKVTLVQFSAGWCGNCRVMKPKFKHFATEHSEAEFIVVDAEKFPESRKLAKVDNLPTFAAFKDGRFLGQVQTNKVESLKNFIDETTNN